MDDGYLVGPREVIFEVLSTFARGISEECGCGLDVKKCKMYYEEEAACYEVRREGLISEDLQHLQEGGFVNV